VSLKKRCKQEQAPAVGGGDNKLTKATLHGAFWAYAATYSSKLMVLISTTILARLLLKEDFGIAGYALVITAYLDIINGLGIGPALIYYPKNKETTNIAFWLGLGMGIILFIIAWFLAPLAGKYFNDLRAVPVTRVLALTFPISALSIVHEAILRKELLFKTKAIPDFTRAMGKGLTSIILALLGAGVWSLIFGQLVGVALSVIAYWRVVPWAPSLRFNFYRAPALLSYGLNIVSVKALGVLLLNTDYLLVGRYLGPASLGTYTLAFRIPELIIGQFAEIISQVLFPIYAKIGNTHELYRQRIFLTIRYVSMITVPIGVGLALVAKPFILTLFSDKWIDAAPIMSAISISYTVEALIYNFGDIYKATGHPAILTKISLIRVLILLPALWWTITKLGSLLAVGWTVAVVSFIGMMVQLIVAHRILRIPYLMIMEALRPAAIGCISMAVFVAAALFYCSELPPLLQLVLTVSIGGVTYLGTLWRFQNEVRGTAVSTLRKGLKKGDDK